MKEPAAPREDAVQLAVKVERIEVAGQAEHGRVVDDEIEGRVAKGKDYLGTVANEGRNVGHCEEAAGPRVGTDDLVHRRVELNGCLLYTSDAADE